MELLYKETIKGIILSFLYYEVTRAQDTTFRHIFLFTSFYIIMIYGAMLTDLDTKIVTNAFITKAVFTLVDERLKDINSDKNNSDQK